MAKVVTEIVLGIALVVSAIFLSPLVGPLLAGLLSAGAGIGVSLVMGGIAQVFRHIPGNDVAVRQPAMPWIVVYGRSRIGGCIIYMSLSSNRQWLNMVVVHAAHSCQRINGYWLDGRQVFFSGGGSTSDDLGGVGGGGKWDDNSTHYDPAGNKYNFGGNVFIQSRMGSETGQAFPALHSYDSAWPTTATLQGHCATWFRLQYNQTLWMNGYPQIKVDIAGKNDIYDPRSSSYGYTENWALCMADVLQHPYWGLGCPSAEIDQTQLIAAANLSDESVPIAANGGGFEPRYTVNGSCTTEMSPGQILQSMSTAAAGRIVFAAGLWKIYPAGWIGPSLSFVDDDFIAPIKWMPKRKFRDLGNAVKGTFVCPTFPYTMFGPGYANNNKIGGIFDGQWSATDVPPYAQDPLHGYSLDANLAADGNIRLWQETQLPWTISVSTAQRLLKIFLLRNRQQGSGTISLSLRALQASALDVVQLTHARWSWSNKVVEIVNYRIVVQDGKDGTGPLVYIEADVAETDPSVYTWSTTEELTIEDNPSPAVPGAGIISQATMYPVTSGNKNSAIVGGASPLSASDAGSSVTISIAAFSMQFGFGQVNYNSGSISGQPYSTPLYIYAYDPALAGGTVSYFASSGFQAVVSDQGYLYIGPITTPAASGPPTGGSGPGGGCPCPSMLISDNHMVDELRGGEPLLIRSGDESWYHGEVHEIMGRTICPCVRIEAENGAVYEGSWDTPVHPRAMAPTGAAYCDGAELGTLIGGLFEWSRVRVTELGRKECVKLYCGSAEFASGEDPDKMMFTHNLVVYGK